jgi:hypothetical protein
MLSLIEPQTNINTVDVNDNDDHHYSYCGSGSGWVVMAVVLMPQS